MLFLVVILQAVMILVTLSGGWHIRQDPFFWFVTGNLLVTIAIRSEWGDAITVLVFYQVVQDMDPLEVPSDSRSPSCTTSASLIT
ncbi:hypothetical protein PGT21_000299 [Puccinia graminis f. sp. tritici]|uniref:Uncharacterized protein n=1 Tax=Puccinia graminis f. sp. tritici TaxID=56615 RepID=A0A5B0PLI5_PUCGR|nr:hypothetical protein PGT21_000299 [Puccinia graminis f. sp. tritici]